jgi:hypothetical protein
VSAPRPRSPVACCRRCRSDSVETRPGAVRYLSPLRDPVPPHRRQLMPANWRAGENRSQQAARCLTLLRTGSTRAIRRSDRDVLRARQVPGDQLFAVNPLGGLKYLKRRRRRAKAAATRSAPAKLTCSQTAATDAVRGSADEPHQPHRLRYLTFLLRATKSGSADVRRVTATPLRCSAAEIAPAPACCCDVAVA